MKRKFILFLSLIFANQLFSDFGDLGGALGPAVTQIAQSWEKGHPEVAKTIKRIPASKPVVNANLNPVQALIQVVQNYANQLGAGLSSAAAAARRRIANAIVAAANQIRALVPNIQDNRNRASQALAQTVNWFRNLRQRPGRNAADQAQVNAAVENIENAVAIFEEGNQLMVPGVAAPDHDLAEERALLGIDPNANINLADLARAYRLQSRIWHPDRPQNHGNVAEATARFQAILQAYQNLQRRAQQGQSLNLTGPQQVQALANQSIELVLNGLQDNIARLPQADSQAANTAIAQYVQDLVKAAADLQRNQQQNQNLIQEIQSNAAQLEGPAQGVVQDLARELVIFAPSRPLAIADSPAQAHVEQAAEQLMQNIVALEGTNPSPAQQSSLQIIRQDAIPLMLTASRVAAQRQQTFANLNDVYNSLRQMQPTASSAQLPLIVAARNAAEGYMAANQMIAGNIPNLDLVLAVDQMGLNPDAAGNINIALPELTRQYRNLSRILHPDRGGDTAAFQAMQAAYEFLRARIEQNNNQQIVLTQAQITQAATAHSAEATAAAIAASINALLLTATSEQRAVLTPIPAQIEEFRQAAVAYEAQNQQLSVELDQINRALTEFPNPTSAQTSLINSMQEVTGNAQLLIGMGEQQANVNSNFSVEFLTEIGFKSGNLDDVEEKYENALKKLGFAYNAANLNSLIGKSSEERATAAQQAEAIYKQIEDLEEKYSKFLSLSATEIIQALNKFTQEVSSGSVKPEVIAPAPKEAPSQEVVTFEQAYTQVLVAIEHSQNIPANIQTILDKIPTRGSVKLKLVSKNAPGAFKVITVLNDGDGKYYVMPDLFSQFGGGIDEGAEVVDISDNVPSEPVQEDAVEYRIEQIPTELTLAVIALNGAQPNAEQRQVIDQLESQSRALVPAIAKREVARQRTQSILEQVLSQLNQFQPANDSQRAALQQAQNFITGYMNANQMGSSGSNMPSLNLVAAVERMGFSPDAADNLNVTLQALNQRYKTLSRILHPDKGGNTAEFQAMQAAFELLKDNITQNNNQPIVLTQAQVAQARTAHSAEATAAAIEASINTLLLTAAPAQKDILVDIPAQLTTFRQAAATLQTQQQTLLTQVQQINSTLTTFPNPTDSQATIISSMQETTGSAQLLINMGEQQQEDGNPSSSDQQDKKFKVQLAAIDAKLNSYEQTLNAEAILLSRLNQLQAMPSRTKEQQDELAALRRMTTELGALPSTRQLTSLQKRYSKIASVTSPNDAQVKEATNLWTSVKTFGQSVKPVPSYVQQYVPQSPVEQVAGEVSGNIDSLSQEAGLSEPQQAAVAEASLAAQDLEEAATSQELVQNQVSMTLNQILDKLGTLNADVSNTGKSIVQAATEAVEGYMAAHQMLPSSGVPTYDVVDAALKLCLVNPNGTTSISANTLENKFQLINAYVKTPEVRESYTSAYNTLKTALQSGPINFTTTQMNQAKTSHSTEATAAAINEHLEALADEEEGSSQTQAQIKEIADLIATFKQQAAQNENEQQQVTDAAHALRQTVQELPQQQSSIVSNITSGVHRIVGWLDACWPGFA